VQDAGDGKPGPCRVFERLRIGDVLGDFRGVLKFFFNGRSLASLSSSAAVLLPPAMHVP